MTIIAVSPRLRESLNLSLNLSAPEVHLADLSEQKSDDRALELSFQLNRHAYGNVVYDA